MTLLLALQGLSATLALVAAISATAAFRVSRRSYRSSKDYHALFDARTADVRRRIEENNRVLEQLRAKDDIGKEGSNG